MSKVIKILSATNCCVKKKIAENFKISEENLNCDEYSSSIGILFNIIWDRNYHYRQLPLHLKGLTIKKITNLLQDKQLSIVIEFINLLSSIIDVPLYGAGSLYNSFNHNLAKIFGTEEISKTAWQKRISFDKFLREKVGKGKIWFLFSKRKDLSQQLCKARQLYRNIREFIIHLQAQETHTYANRNEWDYKLQREVPKLTLISYQVKLISKYNENKFKKDKEKAKKADLLYYIHGGRGTCVYLNSLSYEKELSIKLASQSESEQEKPSITLSSDQKEYGHFLYRYNKIISSKETNILKRYIISVLNLEKKQEFIKKFIGIEHQSWEINNWIIKNYLKPRKIVGSYGAIEQMIRISIGKCRGDSDKMDKFISNLRDDWAKELAYKLMIGYKCLPIIKNTWTKNLRKKISSDLQAKLGSDNAQNMQQYIKTSTITHIDNSEKLKISNSVIGTNLKEFIKIGIDKTLKNIITNYFCHTNYKLDQAIEQAALIH